MLKGLCAPLLAVGLAGSLPACTLLPASGPRSDDVHANATAGIRSTASLPYALVDVSADTIGFLSQPNLITFKGTFSDKRPKPMQVVGVGDVLNISIFEAQPGGLFTPGQASGDVGTGLGSQRTRDQVAARRAWPATGRLGRRPP